jgi:osmoprotectant transport system ATP-binding protein
VRLGDRIAVLREGGVLEQYAPPAEVLARPASAFVADFVGADPGLKRLGVTPVDVAALDRPVTVAPGAALDEARRAMDRAPASWAAVVEAGGRLVGQLRAGDAQGDGLVSDRLRPVESRVDAGATLMDVSSALLLADSGWVAVTEGERLLGALTPASLHAAARRSAGG